MEMMMVALEDQSVLDRGGHRCGLDRRAFSYAICLPERRTGQDRRCGRDRRKTRRPKRDQKRRDIAAAHFSAAVAPEE